MKGTIVNYRRGRHTQIMNHMVVKVDGVETKDAAAKLVGKKVTWKTPADNEIVGKVSNAHGNSGAIRVLFEKGMPGQALAKEVNIA